MMLEDLYRLLRSGHVQALGVVDTITQPLVVLDKRFCVLTANNAFVKTFEVERDEVLGESFFDLGDGQWDIADLRQLVADVIPKASAVTGYEVAHSFPSIGARTFLVDVRRLSHPDDNSPNILILFNDVTERRRSDAEKDFVISETRHRMRNVFAVIQSLANRTEVKDRTAAEYRDILLGRIAVTLQSQEIVDTGTTTDLEALLRHSVGELGFDRLRYEGPTVELPGPVVMPVSMIFHELATNALKYGALSVPAGEVHLTWSLEDRPDTTLLRCDWREVNGPPVTAPTRRGYGTQLIEGTSSHVGGNVELQFNPSGLAAVIQIPV